MTVNSTDIFGIDEAVTQTGILGEYRTSSEIRVRFVIENAGPSSLFSIYGRIKGQTAWNAITTLSANAIQDVGVAEFDFILVVCDTYASLSNNVHFLASGIAQSANGISTVTVGATTLAGLDNLNLTSTDSSVILSTTANSVNFAVAGAANIAPLVSLSGMPAGSTNLSTFTGTTIPDSATIKSALQALETPLETAIANISTNTGNIATNTTAIGHLNTLSGVAVNADDLGTFTGVIVPDNATVKAAIQSLETSIANLPDPMEYKGLWSAATNTPTLSNASGNNGDVYQVTAGGTVNFGGGPITFAAGDKAVYNGATAAFEKWYMNDAVSSVNGYTGAVIINKTDVGLNNVDNTSDVNKPISSATQTALNAKEDLTNKATSFTVVNDTLYPSVKAVNDRILQSIGGLSTFVLANVASDISTYLAMPELSLYTPGALATTTVSTNTTPTLLKVFATAVGYPGIVNIPVGTFTCHYETQKAAGGNTYYSYFQLYKRSSAGVETLIATSDNASQFAVNTVIQNTVGAFINTALTLLVTDRLVVKFYSVMVSGTANITLRYDDTTNARLEIPSVSIGYIPEDIANKAIDFSVLNNVKYPTTLAVDTALAAKQATGNYLTALTGEVSASGPGSASATIANSAVIAKTLTGYTAAAGTVSSSDSILSAIQKIDANTTAVAGTAHNGLSGLQGGNSTERYHLSAAQATVATQAATGSLNGYLASTDFATFSGKANVISGDILPASFSAANNQVAAADVTGFAFSAAAIRSFTAHVSVTLVATANKYETFTILGLQKNGSFDISIEGMGDNSGVTFSITSAGQIQYQSTSAAGFVSSTIKYRAICNPV
ncbi:MAG: hypothetical protein ACOYOV_00435 [Bacteroidales bacterium]